MEFRACLETSGFIDFSQTLQLLRSERTEAELHQCASVIGDGADNISNNSFQHMTIQMMIFSIVFCSLSHFSIIVYEFD